MATNEQKNIEKLEKIRAILGMLPESGPLCMSKIVNGIICRLFVIRKTPSKTTPSYKDGYTLLHEDLQRAIGTVEKLLNDGKKMLAAHAIIEAATKRCALVWINQTTKDITLNSLKKSRV